MGFIAVITEIGGDFFHKMGMLMADFLITVVTFLLAFPAAYITTHGIIIE